MKRTAKDGSSWGAPAKRPAPSNPKTRYAFKILCPDKLTTALLGSRGATKDWIQKETGTKLVFSNKGNYFPKTQYRTLAVYSDEPPNIPKALERILKKAVECGNEEQKRSQGLTAEFIGEAPGEYLFRLCLADRATRAVIGPAGTNIQKLRNSSGAKIYVENESFEGNQMLRLSGRPEAILDCIRKVHAVVQQGVGTEEFNHWAQTVNFSEPVPKKVPPPARKAAGVRDHGACHADNDDSDAPAPPNPPAAADGAVVEERTERLADAVAHLPPGAALLQYSITFALPSARIDAISEYVPQVHKATGAAIEIDPPEDSRGPAAAAARLVSVVGPLLNIYAAHIMIMKRSKELEQRELQEERRRRQQEQEEAELEQQSAEYAEENEHERGSQEQQPEEEPCSEGFEAHDQPGSVHDEEHAEGWEAEEKSDRGEEDEDYAGEEEEKDEEKDEEKGPSVPNKEELQAKINSLQAQLSQMLQARKAADDRGGSRGRGDGPRQRSWH